MELEKLKNLSKSEKNTIIAIRNKELLECDKISNDIEQIVLKLKSIDINQFSEDDKRLIYLIYKIYNNYIQGNRLIKDKKSKYYRTFIHF